MHASRSPQVHNPDTHIQFGCLRTVRIPILGLHAALRRTTQTLGLGLRGARCPAHVQASYNPLAAHDSSIRIPTGDLYDPVKRDLLKTEREKALMAAPGQDASSPLGKATLDVRVWDDMHIKATPYGHCVDETGAYVPRALPES
eukprot:364297-Chlamydomonas_euryale.AAC.10